MPTVSDIISIKLNLDSSGLTTGGEQATREVERLKARLHQQGQQIEHTAKNIGEGIFTAMRSVAGLFGVVLSFSGFSQLAQRVAEAGTSLGRFSEATGVVGQRIAELEQALARAGGRADDIR